MQSDPPQILKTDLFGHISKEVLIINGVETTIIVRDLTSARWWTRPVARWLAAREARLLKRLPDWPGLPRLIAWDQQQLRRSYIDGEPMQSIKPTDAFYFRSARTLLHQLHRAGVVHNDTAKEPNWLVRPDGSAGLVDYQLATFFKRRTRCFRTLALEDIRHLLKHKRSYRKHSLTRRELGILATPAVHNRIWRATGKKVYRFVTRRIFRWRDREGANDRNL